MANELSKDALGVRRRYKSAVDVMLQAHLTEPLTARWFSLGAWLAFDGWTVLTYEPTKFTAEHVLPPANQVECTFDVSLCEDGTADWTFCSPFGTVGEEPDYDDLQEEWGSSDGWHSVATDLALLLKGA